MHNRLLLAVLFAISATLILLVSVIAYNTWRFPDVGIARIAPDPARPNLGEMPQPVPGRGSFDLLDARLKNQSLELELEEIRQRLDARSEELATQREENQRILRQMADLQASFNQLLESSPLLNPEDPSPTVGGDTGEDAGAGGESGGETGGPAEGGTSEEPGEEAASPAAKLAQLQQALDETEMLLLLTEEELLLEINALTARLTSLREISAAALAATGESGMGVARDALTHPDPQVRIWAADALRRMRSAATDAIPALEDLANDPDKDVQEAAQRALAAIRD